MIRFFYEGTRYRIKKPITTSRWIKAVIKQENQSLVALNYIFCTDTYLLQINQDFLNHDYYTDIITFNHSTKKRAIYGDIYISIDRVKENARNLSEDLDTEIHRVMIHGVLHLIGFKDKTERQRSQMRKKEEACLSLR